MRILHVIDSLAVGGAETLLTGLCVASKRAGESVELYALRGGGPLEVDVRHAGVPIHSGGSGSVYSPLHVLRLARFLKSRQFDVIHVHLYPAQLWICVASRLCGGKTPIVTTEHSTSNRRRNLLFQLLDRWMYRQFTAIAAISEATRDALLLHVREDLPTKVVLNGIDTARFESRLYGPVHSKSTALVILSIGSLTRVKDQATLIRAIAQIDNAKLILAGDGPLRSELDKLAGEFGVRSRVEFLGVRRDIPQLIARADLYVQASRWEGFCLAAVEAMCGGLPCIVARNSGLKEVVGQAGLYFEPGDAGELAAAIRLLAADPGQRSKMAIQGVAQASRFTLQACYEAYEVLYREAIQKSFAFIGRV